MRMQVLKVMMMLMMMITCIVDPEEILPDLQQRETSLGGAAEAVTFSLSRGPAGHLYPAYLYLYLYPSSSARR